MTTACDYRKKAAEFAAMARGEPDPTRHLQYANLAQSYLRLALHADQNSHIDIGNEAPSLAPDDPGDRADTV